MAQTNVIPLYINSIDRDDIKDSTTNYTISLRKSLRNISSIEIGDVVFPRNDKIINANNNFLQGAITVDGTETVLLVTVPNGNYTEAALAAAFETALNDNETSTAFGFAWTVSYDTFEEKMVMDLTYPDGPVAASWSLSFFYTPLIDVIGIGAGGTSTIVYDGTGTDNISIPCERRPNLLRALYYNVTSKELTPNINTSYIQSLAKSFTIGASNNTLVLDATMRIGPLDKRLPIALTSADIGQGQGVDSDMSDDGNIFVIGTLSKGAYVFTRTSPGGFWVQRTVPFDVAGDAIGRSVAISGDGNTIAIGAPNGLGSVYIYNRQGYDWIFEQQVAGAVQLPPCNFGRSVALSTDGNTLACGGPADDTVVGATWVFTRTGGVWTEEDKLIGTGGVGNIFQGISVALSGDGNTLAIGGSGDNSDAGAVWVFVRSVGVWSQQGAKLVGSGALSGQRGVSVALSSTTGDTLAFGGPAFNGFEGATWVFTRSGVTWSEQDMLVGSGSIGNPNQGTVLI